MYEENIPVIQQQVKQRSMYFFLTEKAKGHLQIASFSKCKLTTSSLKVMLQIYIYIKMDFLL